MIFICILSFIFDGVFSLIFDTNSFFLTLFSLMCLIIIFPYLKNKNNIFYIALIIGLFYDIVYTQTLFLSTILFFCIALMISIYYKYMPYNIINTLILSFLSILLYRFISYVGYLIFSDNLFDFYILIKSIYNSIILNFSYVLVMNGICKMLLKKNKIINKIR